MWVVLFPPMINIRKTLNLRWEQMQEETLILPELDAGVMFEIRISFSNTR